MSYATYKSDTNTYFREAGTMLGLVLATIVITIVLPPELSIVGVVTAALGTFFITLRSILQLVWSLPEEPNPKGRHASDASSDLIYHGGRVRLYRKPNSDPDREFVYSALE